MSELPIEALAVFPPPGVAAPNQFRFTLDDHSVYYLAADSQSAVQQLYRLDIETGEHRIAAAPPGGGTNNETLTPEEELRRQRLRMLTLGITEFQRSKNSDRLLIPQPDGLYVMDGVDAPLRQVLALNPLEDAPILSPRLSPDGEWIAYVQYSELYRVSIQGGQPQQLTWDARGTGKTNGLAEYIAQEELGRSEGFWWSDDSRCILYAQVDETHIPIYRIMHQGKDTVGDTAQEDHRYPFAGQQNAVVRLAIVDVEQPDVPHCWLNLDFPHKFYIGRAFWWPDGSPGAQILNREQNHLDLVKFDPETGSRTLLMREVNDYWISLRRRHFYALQDGNFVWASERSGFNHLYFYDTTGELIRQVTFGKWAVDNIEAVDEENGVVYFTAAKESPLEMHLYSLPLIGGEIEQLTTESGLHNVWLNTHCTQFVDVFHNLETPHTAILVDIESKSPARTIHTPNDPRLQEFDLEPPELVSLENRDGVTLYGAVYRPPKSFGEGPFPTIVHVYGGPGPQMVANSWLLTANLLLQFLRRQGFLVFRLDNRGSARRGMEFESALYRQMGTVEVEDQIDGVRWLVQQGLADLNRVGITGWSYGGYMTLMSMSKAPDIFSVGVAGAPVTGWDGYDTAYTERYMDTPQENPDGYANGSVMSHIDGLRGKLLLVHGLLDENVHFRHTARLINALNRARKPYDLLLFPDERHLPRRQDDRTYMNQRMVDFFVEHL
jgi:dipeptidyl-peptidase-4